MSSAILILKEYFGDKQLEGAEIGVLEGEGAECMLNVLNMKKLYLIDNWSPYKEKGKIYNYSDKYKKVKNKFKNMGVVKIIKKTSEEAVKDFENESLDFVFIDACHDYEFIKQDLEIWSKKVKKGGIICGDDFDDYWDGVKRAVTEFAKKNKYIIEQVMRTDGFIYNNWVIKK